MSDTPVTITVNGQEIACEPGELVISAAERAGAHIPRFCYHERLKPVGMCRMCLVDVDAGRGPGLQPSCMVPVADGMVVDTDSDRAKRAQEGILELLLVNHPLDCPVCDKGGECPLQDNAYGYGPGESRFIEEKRHYEKPIPISDLVHLDRERCILCDRCTRFASEVAGDPLIHFIDRGNATQVNTFPDHPFSSYFSGNTVQVCPVGALTAAPYRFKARPWDLDSVESTATVDSSGARVVVQASRNQVIRNVGLDSDAVNWGWLSDKERFSYEVAHAEGRVTTPRMRVERDDELAPARWSAATKAAARSLTVAPERIAMLGGARLNLEDQYAWAKLVKGLIGSDHVDCQLGDGLPAPMALGLPRATIDEVCAPGGVVVLLGPDPKEELPTLYLRLRYAVVNDGVDLIEMTPGRTSLSSLATVSLHPRPGTIGQVANAMADGVGDVEGVAAAAVTQARSLLDSGRKVTVVLGRANLAESARFTADAVGALVRLVPDVTFLPALRRGNVLGALEMGLTPGFLPGGSRRSGVELDAWPFVPDFDGRDADGILRVAAAGEVDTLVLLGADPLADHPDPDLVERALDQVTTLIAVDAFITDSAAKADIFLPAALFGEVDGTFCNAEGRLSPIRAKVTPSGQAKADWVIAVELASALGFDLGFTTLGALQTELTSTAISLAGVSWDEVDTAPDGVLINRARQWVLEFGDAAARPEGDGLLVVVDHKLWDEGTMVAQSPSLAGLASPAALRLALDDAEQLGLSSCSGTVEVDVGGQTLEVPYTVDGATTAGTVAMSARLPGFDARRLITAGRPVSTLSIRAQEARS